VYQTADEYVPYAICTFCEEPFCLTCVHFNDKLPDFPPESPIDDKNLNIYTNVENTDYEKVVHEDDEEQFVAIGCCPSCGEYEKFMIYLHIKQRVKRCTRCTVWFDEKHPSGCRKHTGEHEMVLDSTGKATYGYATWLDYGINEMIVFPYYYPARYTCCGELCRHIFPQCQDLANGKPPDYVIETIDVPELGCIAVDHTTEPLPDHCGYVCGQDISTLDKNWKQKINWNVSAPSHYPSGVKCPSQITDLYDDMPIETQM
jgi:hypothetical protein